MQNMSSGTFASSLTIHFMASASIITSVIEIVNSQNLTIFKEIFAYGRHLPGREDDQATDGLLLSLVGHPDQERMMRANSRLQNADYP
jgi:hypothetical protein